MTAVGVDLDSRAVAIAVIDPTSAVATRLTRIVVPSKITERTAILRYLREGLEEHRDWFSHPTYVESPVLAGAKNIQSTIKVAGVYGLTLALVSAWTPVIEVAISTWKRDVVGNGNANKLAVTDWLMAHQRAVFLKTLSPAGKSDQNLVDAACIALYGEHHRHVGDVLSGELAS